MKHDFKRLHTPDGFRHALVFQGRKYCQAVMITDTGVRVIKIKFDDLRGETVDGYPVDRAARRFARAGRDLGITRKAQHLIRKAT